MSEPANGNGIWKYIAIAALGALGGLFTGQFIPNRNIVTNDQLQAAVAPLNQQMSTQNAQIADLSQRVAILTGELQGQERTKH